MWKAAVPTSAHTDKNLIKGSEMRLFWTGALTLRSPIAGGRGLSLLPLPDPQLPLLRHCGAPGPEMGEEALAQPP